MGDAWVTLVGTLVDERLIRLEVVLVLALSTSTPAVTAGLVDVDPEHHVDPEQHADPEQRSVLLAERVTVDAHKHGELLAPSIAAVLAEAGRRPADLAAIVCDVGPGPFTGLRVGIVTAAALADALGIPAYAVCGLDALADQALSQTARTQTALSQTARTQTARTHAARTQASRAPAVEDPLLVATDGRRKEIYWALYRNGNREQGPAVGRPAEVASRLPQGTWAVGDGARRYALDLGISVEQPWYPEPWYLARAAEERICPYAPPDTLEPRYLRRPDAVANLTRTAVSRL